MHIHQTLLFMHNNIHNVFQYSYNYNTRNANKTFYKPLFKTKLGQKSIDFRGPELWNKIIPTELQDISFNEFKSKQ